MQTELKTIGPYALMLQNWRHLIFDSSIIQHQTEAQGTMQIKI